MGATEPLLVDCHHHVYEAGRPHLPGTRPSMDAPAEAHAALRARLGVTHHVLVQPSSYGFDDALHLAARAANPARSRVVSVRPPDTPPAECGRLRAAGVVGLRLNLLHPAPLGEEALPGLARLCAREGWHLQLVAEADRLAALAPRLSELPCALVLDHYAMLPPEGFARHPAWAPVARLLSSGRSWVKLSSPYALAPGDLAPLTRALAAEAAERLVWGSNWPHPNAEAPQDEAALLREALEPLDAARRARVRWDNPAALYGLDP